MRLRGLAAGLAILCMLPVLPAFATGADPRLALRSLGDPKAPVTVDEYASLACPHCAEFAKDYLPKLKADYIDTGKVRLVFHDVPIWPIGVKAAMLTRCMPPEYYFPMIDALFRTQPAWVQQQGDQAQIEALKQQAKLAGLRGEEVDECLSDRGLEDGILQEQLDASKPPASVNSTPTFIVDGDSSAKIEKGDYEALKAEIDKRLRK